jgi:hypothetical protein
LSLLWVAVKRGYGPQARRYRLRVLRSRRGFGLSGDLLGGTLGIERLDLAFGQYCLQGDPSRPAGREGLLLAVLLVVIFMLPFLYGVFVQPLLNR